MEYCGPPYPKKSAGRIYLTPYVGRNIVCSLRQQCMALVHTVPKKKREKDSALTPLLVNGGNK